MVFLSRENKGPSSGPFQNAQKLLSESGYLRDQSTIRHLIDEVSMTTIGNDLSIFKKFKKQSLIANNSV